MFDYDQFAESLKSFRIGYGYTQEELAEKLGIEWNYLSDIERKVYKPSTTLVISVLNVFNQSLNSFLYNGLSDDNIKVAKVMKRLSSLELNDVEKEFILNILIAINKRKNVNG